MDTDGNGFDELTSSRHGPAHYAHHYNRRPSTGNGPELRPAGQGLKLAASFLFKIAFPIE
uniref:Uncharacterized protein n=1 Tax=Oryza glumipatula TaxID=40148 RepID=A0A0D9ZV26_9ORYZ